MLYSAEAMPVPVLLLTFAFNRTGGRELRALGPEKEALEVALRPAESDERFKVVTVPDVTLDGLTRIIDLYNDRIAVFHFAGHAGPGHIELGAPAGVMIDAVAEGIAKRLGELPRLRLICLNGCATAAQRELLAHWCPNAAVVTTEQAVLDEIARAFAEQFYRALGLGVSVESAFKRSEARLRSEHHSPVTTRMLEPAGDPDAGDAWPWRLDGPPAARAWQLFYPTAERDSRRAGVDVTIGDLPLLGSRFVGRGAELDVLDEAWADEAIQVQTIIGMAGEGKSALIARWLEQMRDDGWRGATKVFAWRFGGRGRGEERDAPVPAFIDAMLDWLGDEASGGSLRVRVTRLVRLIRQYCVLLVLDGLEVLQLPPEDGGGLKDRSLVSFLSELCFQMRGLCVVSSRMSVVDLSVGGSVRERRIRGLSPPEGADLLGGLGVRGPRDALERASEEAHGHAMALTLLGSYLATYEDGDVTRRKWEGGQGAELARRLMADYDLIIDPASRQVLRILALFDRAPPREWLEVVLDDPPIDGLTDALDGLDGDAWGRATTDLQGLGLVFVSQGGEAMIDAHALVRDYFSGMLEAESAPAWREANLRLYEYFEWRSDPGAGGTSPAYECLRALHHGCAAGRKQEALVDILYERLREGGQSSSRLQGAYSGSLVALAPFFSVRWTTPDMSLEPPWQAWVLTEAAVALKALGQPAKAIAPLAAAFERRVELGETENAARVAGSLSGILSSAGRLERPAGARGGGVARGGSIACAREAVRLADESRDLFLRVATRTDLAEALHHRGRLRAAMALYVEAERLYRIEEPLRRYLPAMQGYRYCDLLLELDPPSALLRAEWMVGLPERYFRESTVALSKLLLGRALHATAHETESLERAEPLFNEAVQTFQSIEARDMEAVARLHRAAHSRRRGELPAAQLDLREVRELAARAGFRLVLADAHIEGCHQAVARGDRAAASAEFAAACALVEEIAYHRCDRQLTDLSARLGLEPPAWLGRADVMVDIPIAVDVPDAPPAPAGVSDEWWAYALAYRVAGPGADGGPPTAGELMARLLARSAGAE